MVFGTLSYERFWQTGGSPLPLGAGHAYGGIYYRGRGWKIFISPDVR